MSRVQQTQIPDHAVQCNTHSFTKPHLFILGALRLSAASASHASRRCNRPQDVPPLPVYTQLRVVHRPLPWLEFTARLHHCCSRHSLTSHHTVSDGDWHTCDNCLVLRPHLWILGALCLSAASASHASPTQVQAQVNLCTQDITLRCSKWAHVQTHTCSSWAPCACQLPAHPKPHGSGSGQTGSGQPHLAAACQRPCTHNGMQLC
jgi:hypothetical protein